MCHLSLTFLADCLWLWLDCCHSGSWRHPLTVSDTSWHWSVLHIVYLDKFFKGVKAMFSSQSQSVSDIVPIELGQTYLWFFFFMIPRKGKRTYIHAARWKPLIFIRPDCSCPSNISVLACHWHQFGKQRQYICCASCITLADLSDTKWNKHKQTNTFFIKFTFFLFWQLRNPF